MKNNKNEIILFVINLKIVCLPMNITKVHIKYFKTNWI